MQTLRVRFTCCRVRLTEAHLTQGSALGFSWSPPPFQRMKDALPLSLFLSLSFSKVLCLIGTQYQSWFAPNCPDVLEPSVPHSTHPIPTDGSKLVTWGGGGGEWWWRGPALQGKLYFIDTQTHGILSTL